MGRKEQEEEGTSSFSQLSPVRVLMSALVMEILNREDSTSAGGPLDTACTT